MQPENLTWAVLGSSSGGPETAEPPYHVRTVDFMIAFGTFDADAARHAVPQELEVDLAQPGFVSLYSAPTGWGIAPFQAFFVAVPVVGFNSPDGSNGYFMVEGYYSGRAGPVMHEHYNVRLHPGEVRQRNNGTRWEGEVGPSVNPIAKFAMNPILPRPETPLTAGVHHYLGLRRDGGLNIYSVAYSTQFFPSSHVHLEFGANASPLLQSMKLESTVFSSLMVEMPLTFSPPRPLATPQSEVLLQSARMSFLDLLSRLSRPVALIGLSGRVIFANETGESLLRGSNTSSLVAGLEPQDRSRLREMVERVGNSSPSAMTEPILLSPGHLARPMICKAIPVSATLAGERAALLMFDEPTRPVRTDTALALQLFGLTPAEARVAARIGNGQTAKEASVDLGVTENTVRSTLQVVYEKLQIQKQSELARIVLRLEDFGLV